jgi:hypothetical protein
MLKKFSEIINLNRLLLLLFTVFIVIHLGPLLIKHHQYLHDLWTINDDQRQQIFEFYYEEGNWLFKGDYISDYFKRVFLPLGFSALYSLAGLLGDPLIFSKYLQEILFISFLIFMFLIGKVQENSLVGILCLLSGFITVIYLDRISGGLPRAFSYPLMAGFLWGLIMGNMWIVIFMFLLQVLFYPPATLPCAITLAIWVLFPKLTGLNTKKIHLKRRLLLLALLGVLSIILVLPNIIRSYSYGESVTLNMIQEYPEKGPQGRFAKSDIPPFPSLKTQIIKIVNISFSGNGILHIDKKEKNLLLLIIGFISSIGWLFLLYKRSKAIWLIIYFISACLAYKLSSLFYPYLYIPQRVLLYTVPLIVHLGLILGFVEFIKVFFKRKYVSKIDPVRLATMFIFVVITFFLIDQNFPGAGLQNKQDNAKILNYLKDNLTDKALIAGWPTEVDDIPLLSKKKILVGYETYIVSHRYYVLEMRRRTSAVIDAYLSDEIKAIKRLRDEFNVTHLIVNWEYFQPVTSDRNQLPLFLAPSLFEPYQAKISELLNRVNPHKRAIFKLSKDIEEVRIGNISILDLRKIDM